LNLPPSNGKSGHQLIDLLLCIFSGVGCQVGIFARRQYAAMTKYFLHFKQINARLN